MFHGTSYLLIFDKNGWAPLWATSSRTPLVTLKKMDLKSKELVPCFRGFWSAIPLPTLFLTCPKVPNTIWPTKHASKLLGLIATDTWVFAFPLPLTKKSV
jgi:hypothetical protein